MCMEFIQRFPLENVFTFPRHYPQPKPTVVVDNPEMQRMRLLTDIQSNVRFDDVCSTR